MSSRLGLCQRRSGLDVVDKPRVLDLPGSVAAPLSILSANCIGLILVELGVVILW
jgi:hypothetical protein